MFWLGNVSRHPCWSNGSGGVQEAAQQQAAHKLTQLVLAASLPALLTNVLLGAYSDYIGRRLLFSVSLTGYLFQFSVPALVAFLHLRLDWLLVGHVLSGVCGSFYAFLLAVNVYNADNTPPDSTRTLGMAVLGTGGSLASIAGALGGGFMIEYGGYAYPFLVAALLAGLALIVHAVCLAETRPHQAGVQCPSPSQAVKDVFGFYVLKSASSEPAQCDVLSRGGVLDPLIPHQQPVAGDRRLEYCLGLLVFFLVLMPLLGSGGIDTLYVLNRPFCWSPSKIGVYNTVRGLLQHCLSLLALRLLARVVGDAWIGGLGMLSMGAGFLTMGLAHTDWMLYVGEQ